MNQKNICDQDVRHKTEKKMYKENSLPKFSGLVVEFAFEISIAKEKKNLRSFCFYGTQIQHQIFLRIEHLTNKLRITYVY